jgi:quercetin dioxygenase-like cupin family protein
MTDSSKSSPQPEAVIPPDDLQRRLTVAYPDNPKKRHVSIAGDTYTILVSGVETAGRYCLIDMHVPAGGGPPPHRHNFEEMFTLLEGELEFTFRG